MPPAKIQAFAPMFALLIAIAGRADERPDFFESRIRPLLSTHCYECHGHKSKGGLRLDSLAATLRGGETGPAIIPGKPDESLLFHAIDHRIPDLSMPPDTKLSDREIEDIRHWIQTGALWPDAVKIGFTGGKITPEQRRHWSFQAVATPSPPIPEYDGGRNPIDAFIQAKLKPLDLAQVGSADKRQLIRRATFDLIGLPPSIEETDSFVRDESADAWARLISRLLDSPHYGERWGRHWLDLVRYADTSGDAADYPVPEAWKYRNYVIDAFNKDTPYYQFIREQIAGDLLPSESDDDRWKKILATGYVAMARRVGVSPQNLKHIVIEDTLNNIGKTFLGLTIGCARCHDHKFDPIPSSDYYALYGIFNSTRYPHAGAEHAPYRKNFVYRMGKQADEVLRPYRERLAHWNKRERQKYAEYKAFQTEEVTGPKTRESTWAELETVRADRAAVAATFPYMSIAFAVSEGDAADAHVMKQGDPSKRARGEQVRRGFLQILGGQKLQPDAKGSGRRELADWIASDDNPLTARVMVNRIWHWHFGRGLVETVSDFGTRGATPSHPALLDFLATEFVRNGWSVKHMHRLIMLSETYRARSTQPSHRDQSKIDPTNRWYWRGNRHRLDAEQVHDSVLYLSGQLDTSPGARHLFPHRLTYFYRQHEPFQEQYTSKKRSVYQMQARIRKNAYLELFDGPDGNLHLGDRGETTTALQALYFLNSEFIHEQSEAIAGRLTREDEPKEKTLRRLYETLFNRPPSSSDHSFANQAGYGKTLPWPAVIRAMLSSNEFMYVD